ncbi:TLDc [Macleaya cordata]|uniref:TLDc n=1 Tax=Macleaya cordata TaxID=56857 RepID=A0A200QQW4_MACCD|nr:TLDc [Macleaya cordata]
MGASSSTNQKASQEQQELESLATSTGGLPILQKAFSKLSDPQTNSIPLKSLQECFCLTFTNPMSKISPVPECFLKLLCQLGPAIVDLFFTVDKGGVHWIEFLRGYIRCCGRMSSSVSLNTLYRLYAGTSAKAGFPSKLEFESEDDDSKISGYFMSSDVLMLLWMCWTMSWCSEFSKFSKHQAELDLPDVNHLILSAVTSCTEVSNDVNVWNCSISGLEVQLPAQKLHMWALTTVPSLAHCFTQYVHDRLQRCTTSEESETSSLSVGESSSTESHNTCLLTCGRAWAISLTLTSTLSKELLRACVTRGGDGELENLLYRSSLHGMGLNRFWSNVDGYHGPLLLLISASSIESCEGDSSAGSWVIGVLTQQGFENKNVFYGSSGYLYAISPIFHVYSPHGRDKNFVYSHLHSTGVYEAHPKPAGVAFGGTPGNERILIDEDFARITVRHHAVDKTYRPGSLFPNQGYLPSEASITEVEVWGLGGEKVKEQQNAYRNREQLFTEQRRKVDLNSFGNWEDSPEKMMMDMVSDPNRPRREER